MFPDRRRFLLANASLCAALALPSPLLAQAPQAENPKASIEVPMLDPWVPPPVRKEMARLPASTEGAALQAQVERKLRAAFDAAAPGGTLTRDQARAAGLGFIANHFDEIDRDKSGVVRVEEYLRFVRERGAGMINR